MRDDQERLQDIIEAIERIEKYAQQGKSAFEEQELIQTWIVYHLQVVGEAARVITPEFKAIYSAIPWRDVGDLRNLVVHEYFRIDLAVIWDIVEHDLPPFKRQILGILESDEQ